MQNEVLWTRNLHQRVSLHGVCLGQTILTTERHRYLSRLDPTSGEVLWSNKIKNPWGWLTIHDNLVYYLNQYNYLQKFDLSSGIAYSNTELDIRFPGYVLICDKAIISGGWRGYSNLVAWDLDNFGKLWEFKMASDKLQSISVPTVIGDHVIVANHTSNELLFLRINSGLVDKELVLPDDLEGLDLGRSFAVVREQIIFTSKQGRLYKLNENYDGWDTEILNVQGYKNEHSNFYW